MKYVKMLGLLAIAASALMAFSASASAVTVTAPTGTLYTEHIEATSTNSALDGAFVTVTCKNSTVTSSIDSHGAAVTVKGTISTLDFTECNFPVTVKKGGTLELHAINKGVTPHETCTEKIGGVTNDTCEGTLTSSGAEVVIETSVGSCTFTTNNTSVGNVTTTSQTGGKAVLDIKGTIPRTAGNFLCGANGTWTGNYTVQTPTTLWLDE